jgi:hypothetical protein
MVAIRHNDVINAVIAKVINYSDSNNLTSFTATPSNGLYITNLNSPLTPIIHDPTPSSTHLSIPNTCNKNPT